jgi:undecaprenyl-diphosphatase
MFFNLDVPILVELNSIVANNQLAAKVFCAVGSNPILRGGPVFFFMAALWFSGGCKMRRGRMLAGLLAACLATFLSVSLQHHLVTHIRPFQDPALHLAHIDAVPEVALPAMTPRLIDSFPSDTATLFFSLATIIYLEHRMAGSIAFLWSLITTGFVRVALGWHYPSDIAGGIILGVAFVYLFTRFQTIETVFERWLQLCERRIYIVHALLFLFLADAFSLFAGVRGILLLLLAARTSIMKS